MKNIHVIPSRKPIGIHFLDYHITSSEEIKDGDWVYNEYQKIAIKFTAGSGIGLCKKIILTTDPDLIADGVQAIDDEFLQWFVKNPKCEEVEVELEEIVVGSYDAKGLKKIYDDVYKIIIPIEETKQETIEIQPNLFNAAIGGIACAYSVTANLRYAMKLIKIDVDTFHSVLRLQQMWQGSDGSQKWEWVEVVD
jgi:hypothetical protein